MINPSRPSPAFRTASDKSWVWRPGNEANFNLCNVWQIANVLQQANKLYKTVMQSSKLSYAGSLVHVLIAAICCRYQFNQGDLLLADKALQQQREWGIKKLELGLSLTMEASLIQVCPLRAGSLHWQRGHTKLQRSHKEHPGACLPKWGWALSTRSSMKNWPCLWCVVATVSVLFRPLCCII